MTEEKSGMRQARILLSAGIVGLVFAVAPTLAAETTGVFLPSSTESYSLNAVKRAFLSRKWNVVHADDSSVTGALQHRGVDAKLTIYRQENGLSYRCECSRERKVRKIGGRWSTVTDYDYLPDNWIENLKRDTLSFSSHPASRPTAQSPPSSIEMRLLKLDDLRDRGLITEQEYRDARSKVLDEI